MGLAMVQVLTNEKLCGKIEVRNSEKGALFEIRVPLTKVNNQLLNIPSI